MKQTISVDGSRYADGRVRFYGDPGRLVLTQGNPSHVEFVLKKTAAKK